MSKHKCCCIFKHACTPQEKEAALKRLERARSVGDTNGVILALASLGPCPSAR